MQGILHRFERVRPFSSDEAWLLFRLAAWSEAVGWSLLLLGLGLKTFVFHGNNIPVLIAGQIHGTLFILYMAASLILYPSLGWRRLQALAALAASVPPYGSLVFEQWAAHRLQHSSFKLQTQLALYRRLTQPA